MPRRPRLAVAGIPWHIIQREYNQILETVVCLRYTVKRLQRY